MGNIIPCSGKKTLPSVPQAKGKRDAILEALRHDIRGHGNCVFEGLLDNIPDSAKGDLSSLLLNKPDSEKDANCLQHYSVASGTRYDHNEGEFWFPENSKSKLWFPEEYHENIFLSGTPGWDELGRTELHLASLYLCKEVVQKVLLSGVNINLTVLMSGHLPLNVAVIASTFTDGAILAAGVECVKLLLRNGAEVRLRDRDGCEAIHLACWGGREDLVNLLRDYGADVNSLMRQQESPLYLFLEKRSTLRQAQLLYKLLRVSYPLIITNAEGRLPRWFDPPLGFNFHSLGPLKYVLFRVRSEILPLQEICKCNIRKVLRGNMKRWVETKLPNALWKSIYCMWTKNSNMHQK